MQNSRIFCERERPSICERKAVWSKCENGEGEWGETRHTGVRCSRASQARIGLTALRAFRKRPKTTVSQSSLVDFIGFLFLYDVNTRLDHNFTVILPMAHPRRPRGDIFGCAIFSARKYTSRAEEPLGLGFYCMLLVYVSRPSQILPTNDIEIVEIPDRLGWTGTNLEDLENRERFYFLNASQISSMVGDHSRQMKTQTCTVGDVRVRRRWISLITNPLHCWAPVPHHK